MEIVRKRKQLNICLQGKYNLIIDACKQVKAFQKNMLLFETQLKNNTQHFPILKVFKNSEP